MNKKEPYKREHLGPIEPFPTDPGRIIKFLTSQGRTPAEQKEFMEFTSEQLCLAGSHPPSESEIRKRWEARKQVGT